MPGVLELLPLEQAAFQGMLDTIRRNFERYGFLGIETPAIEYADLLLTKSGGETERQVYFVQSPERSNWTSSVQEFIRQQVLDGLEPDDAALAPSNQSELALRFDLTVPLARYVAEHERELAFPFRRHQIQRVYRGESAQRGRFREFYQCDIDVIGKDTLPFCYDAEIPAVIWSVFTELGIGPFTIQINNRKFLRGLLESLGLIDSEVQFAVLREVDKTDKRGRGATSDALRAMGLPEDVVTRLLYLLIDYKSSRERATRETVAMKLQELPEAERATADPDVILLRAIPGLVPEQNALMRQGIEELAEVFELMGKFGVPRDRYRMNLSIARGLDYYTGTIYETTLDDYPAIGSICSGGRYENLAGHYTSSKLPGVGISIGATRLYWQLREAGLIKAGRSPVQALVTQLDAAHLPHYLELARELRAAGIATEAVLEPRKLARQFQYADRAGIRFVLVLGSEELAQGTVTMKDLREGTQQAVARSNLIEHLRAAGAGGA
jgi:histidyl-tRNA synthetase